MTNEERDRLFDVVFDGTQSLLGDRLTKKEGSVYREKRAYNKTGNHAKSKDYWKKFEKEHE